MLYLDREVWIDYTNWRGERAWRRIIPFSIAFGLNAWHTEAQWILKATDSGKSEERTFAMKDIHEWRTSPPSK